MEERGPKAYESDRTFAGDALSPAPPLDAAFPVDPNPTQVEVIEKDPVLNLLERALRCHTPGAGWDRTIVALLRAHGRLKGDA